MNFAPRRIQTAAHWLDPDQIKLYTVSAHGGAVDQDRYHPQLQAMKAARRRDWSATPAFAIYHDGASHRYLVLAWWDNENELFTAVAAETAAGWIEDAARFSFCLWDLEIMWFERNAFVQTLYSGAPDPAAYRACRLGD